jgi:hypothetical protein
MTRLLILALLATSACAPVYIPNVRNSPMFTKGGEFQASVQIGNGIEAQSAMAVTEHFAVMANYLYLEATNMENEEVYNRHTFFEGAIGYFSNKDDSFFEVFAGYGRGKGSTNDGFDFLDSDALSATGRYERYFIQPALGLNKNVVNISFAPRISMVDFYEFSTEVGRNAIHESPKFFFEPAVIGRTNFANNHMYFVFQGGLSFGLSENIYFDRRNFQFSAGLGLRLGGTKELASRL